MKNVIVSALCIVMTSATTFAQDNPFTTKWDNGFSVASKDGRFKMKFGGRLMYDIAYFNQNADVEAAFGELRSGNEFRRARFFNSGEIYGNIGYKFEIDFAGGEVSIKDAFIQLSDIPVVGNLRVGQFKEPFRLEVLTSSRYLMFMERAYQTSFMPERNTGMMIFNDHADDRLGWQLGVFRNSDGNGDDPAAGDDYNITARIGGLPFVNADQSRYLHLGAAISSRHPKGDLYGFASRASAHMTPRYVSTGLIQNVNRVMLAGFEAAGVLGAFSLEGEWVVASVDVPGSDLTFSTYYIQTSYFLTGEHRVYKSAGEGFDRVKPKADFGNGSGGAGAWELGARYTSIDLNDGNVSGGQMNEYTLGVNWYLNTATRVMVNYVLADIQDLGNVGIFQTRFQVDF
jgi:phosphate-selective porin OprO/OprP